jgi:NAD(P)-dependent dehydrogenase (short-subunit alcohol dehydrogenase family)
MLTRLPDGFTALVTGASGGIGGAVIDALLASDRPDRVIGVSRYTTHREDDRFSSLVLDITTDAGLEELARKLEDQALHLVFNAIGMLHDASSGIAPEKKLDDLDVEAMTRLFHVNATTPALLLKALQGNLKGGHTLIFCSLSARVGSIGDNPLGGWYAYRASKAAHNMLIRTAAIEVRRLNPNATLLSLHPGTTDTPLSLPFQSRVPEGKLFTPAFVAQRLLQVLDHHGPEDSGSFLDWDDASIPW